MFIIFYSYISFAKSRSWIFYNSWFEFVPQRFRIGSESRFSRLSKRWFRETLFDRTYLARSTLKRLRRRTSLQFAIGSRVSTFCDSVSIAGQIKAASMWPSTSRSSSSHTWIIGSWSSLLCFIFRRYRLWNPHRTRSCDSHYFSLIITSYIANCKHHPFQSVGFWNHINRFGKKAVLPPPLFHRFRVPLRTGPWKPYMEPRCKHHWKDQFKVIEIFVFWNNLLWN